MTLHKWAGLRDGRFSGKKLVSLLDDDIYYEPAKDRMKHVDILIVDEISMLSAASLDNLESVMRHVRELEQPFGGAQVVLVGDFLQLPPVANQRYQDPGEFCFSSPSFPAHRLFLSEKMRHTDKALADIVAAVSVGSVAPDMESQIRRLSRPLAGTNSTKMFATNIQADIYNRDQLVQMDGPMYEFVAVDEGRETELNRLVVQKTLWLKDAAAVMLLRNLSDRLVNGLQGTVSAVREGEVDVFFPTLQNTHSLSRMHFTGKHNHVYM